MDESSRKPRKMRFEAVDDETARVLRSMTGAERLRIASGMVTSARKMLVSHLRSEHPDWTDDEIRREVFRRFHGMEEPGP